MSLQGWQRAVRNQHPASGITDFWADLEVSFTKASILRRSAFFMVQLSHPYMTTGKTIALTRQTFVISVAAQMCILGWGVKGGGQDHLCWSLPALSPSGWLLDSLWACEAHCLSQPISQEVKGIPRLRELCSFIAHPQGHKSCPSSFFF